MKSKLITPALLGFFNGFGNLKHSTGIAIQHGYSYPVVSRANAEFKRNRRQELKQSAKNQSK